MFNRFDHRAGHWFLLLVVWACVCLPNLGRPVLWDIDEGLNAEASREMLASGNLVVPTFNYQLRTAKPALLYWMQIGCFQLLGVNETAARLPSALAGLLTMLVVYEMGRAAFGAGAGLLAGVVLASSFSFLGSAHFGNPDALLLAFATLSLASSWRFWQSGRVLWLYLACIASGFAVLAKGPVGLVLPTGVVLLYLAWQGQLRRLLDWRLVEAGFVFVLVAAPWYVWVGVETKGVFLREFWNKQHLDRVATAMENHSGSPLYYVVVFWLGLLPWSVFLGPVLWWVRKNLPRTPEAAPRLEERDTVRFLVVWFAVFFVFFSCVRTKLPNYILPVYPPAALLTAFTLDRWRNGSFVLPAWVMRTSLVCLALVGLCTSAGLLVASGVVEQRMLGNLYFPGLALWAWVGAVPVLAAVAGWRLLGRSSSGGMLVAVSVGAVLFVAPLVGGAVVAIDDLKATRPLAALLPGDHLNREVRLGAFRYDRPSLVFYCRREVRRMDQPEQALEFLQQPLPVYLFVGEANWEELRTRMPANARVVGRHPDLYASGKGVVVVTNTVP